MSEELSSAAALREELEVARRRVAELEQHLLELQESENRFRILSELISDCCWARWGTVEGATQRTWVNDAFRTLTGYTPEEFEAIGREGLVHPDDLAAILERVDGPLGVSEHEFRIVRKDGQVRWLRERMVVEQDGEKLYVLGATQDVTAQKEAEALLRESSAILERRVAARTAELAEINHLLELEIRERERSQETLQRALDGALEASRAKSRFLANMSHEIRTPMNGIVGLAGLLLKDELPPRSAEHVEILRASAESLLELIDQVLDFSKIEADRLTLEKVAFPLREVQSAVIGMLAQKAAAKGLELELSLADDVPSHLLGDPARLRQILLNLVDNAVKFTAAGKVELAVRRLGVDGEPTWLRFVVRDSGIGIDEEVARRLFAPFTQADGSTARRFGGTGLGLAISRRLAELMGGTIELASTPGVGSAFTVDLPFELAPAPVVVRRERPSSPPPRPGGARILVAEDSRVNQIVIALQLQALGYNPHIVESGEEAIAAFADGEFDLILMDCQMPGVDGFEATRLIRARGGAGAEVPILAVTASALREDLERCESAGMDAALTKPYREEQLAALIAAWLGAGAAKRDKAKVERPLPEALFVGLPAGLAQHRLESLHRLERESGQPVLARALGTFLELLPVRRALLHTTFERHDRAAFCAAAHALRGSAGVLGAERLADLSRELEEGSRHEIPADCAARLAAFDAECAAVDRAFRDLLDRLAKAPPAARAAVPTAS